MGYNTTVLLYNDQADRWPKEIWRATAGWMRPGIREKYARGRTDDCFGYGRVISTAHADTNQVIIAGQNYGRFLTEIDKPEYDGDLEVLANLLRCHGYTVRAPGEKRGRGPHPWGWWAREGKASLTPAPEDQA